MTKYSSIGFRVSTERKAEIEQAALIDGISMSAWIKRALEAALRDVSEAPSTFCIECGNPTESNGTGYCPSCYVRFTAEGFYGMGVRDA